MAECSDIPDNKLLWMLKTMMRIRAFEEEIIKVYPEEEIRSPNHLYIGHEAVATGVCAALRAGDKVFSYYRSHGHFLAKGGDSKAMMAELYGKTTGSNKGRGGSMLLASPQTGFMGSTAIVGGGIPIAVGLALSFKMQKKSDIVVSFFGDAAADEGILYESLNFAALKRLPIIFVCENNFYAVESPIESRQSAPENIAKRAGTYKMPSAKIDGNDILAVFEETSNAVNRIVNGEGPSFIEAQTYRWREHVGPGLDHEKGWRPKEEWEAWQKKCPIKRFKLALFDKGILFDFEKGRFTVDKLTLIEDEIRCDIENAFSFAKNSPRLKISEMTHGTYPGPKISDMTTDYFYETYPENKKTRSAKNLKFNEAIGEALVQIMDVDNKVFVMGEGVDSPTGIFGTTKPAHKKFPDRVFDTPLSEHGLTGWGSGAALDGMRPVMVHARIDFLMLAMDQIINHAAKWNYMQGGDSKVPWTIRAIIGRGWGNGAQHTQSLQSLFAHIPGLKVVMPSNAYNAKGLLISAIKDDAPVIFIEHRWLGEKESLVPEELYSMPLGRALIPKEGCDLTIVSYSYMTFEALKAVDELSKIYGISAELVDLCSLRPLDSPTIINSVRKTKRLLVADLGWKLFGVGAEIIALTAENCFSSLKTAPIRIALPDCPTPADPLLEKHYYPGSKEIVRKALLLLNRESEFIDQDKEEISSGPGIKSSF